MEDENKLKEKLGLGPDEDYLCFSRMGGAGVIQCDDCGHEEEIVSFTHGMMSCDIGRQCPNCHAFVVEHSEHGFEETTEDFVCPEQWSVVAFQEVFFLFPDDRSTFWCISSLY